jgi:hypothetical protein
MWLGNNNQLPSYPIKVQVMRSSANEDDAYKWNNNYILIILWFLLAS